MLYYNLDPDTGAAINVNDRDPASGAVVSDSDLEAVSTDDGNPVFPCVGPPGCTLGGCSPTQRHLLRPAAGIVSDLKPSMLDNIDSNSDALIANGFVYNGITFSLSSNAQLKWLGLAIGAAGLTFPYSVPSIDDTQSYAIPDAATVPLIYAAAMTRVATILAEGVALKNQINAATDLATLQAIVDNRT